MLAGRGMPLYCRRWPNALPISIANDGPTFAVDEGPMHCGYLGMNGIMSIIPYRASPIIALYGMEWVGCKITKAVNTTTMKWPTAVDSAGNLDAESARELTIFNDRYNKH